MRPREMAGNELRPPVVRGRLLVASMAMLTAFCIAVFLLTLCFEPGLMHRVVIRLDELPKSSRTRAYCLKTNTRR